MRSKPSGPHPGTYPPQTQKVGCMNILAPSPDESGPCPCGYAFSTLSAYRRHRKGDEHIKPDKLKFVLHKDGRYGPPGSPVLREILPNGWEAKPSIRPKARLNVVKEQRSNDPPPNSMVGTATMTARQTDTSNLECAACGTVFAKRPGRGRPPKNCYDCRGAI